LTLYCYTN